MGSGSSNIKPRVLTPEELQYEKENVDTNTWTKVKNLPYLSDAVMKIRADWGPFKFPSRRSHEYDTSMPHYGPYKNEAGEVYMGQFKDGQPHGEGKSYWPNGDWHKGEYFQGVKHGAGLYIWSKEESSYQGYWENNVRTGKGTFKEKSGDSYIGDHKDEKRHGHGKLVVVSDPNGEYEYVGDFVLGQKHGVGSLKVQNGEFYEGQWNADLKHGNGKAAYPNGNVYQGEF